MIGISHITLSSVECTQEQTCGIPNYTAYVLNEFANELCIIFMYKSRDSLNMHGILFRFLTNLMIQ